MEDAPQFIRTGEVVSDEEEQQKVHQETSNLLKEKIDPR